MSAANLTPEERAQAIERARKIGMTYKVLPDGSLGDLVFLDSPEAPEPKLDQPAETEAAARRPQKITTTLRAHKPGGSMNANLSFEEWLRTRNYPAGMAEQYRETLEILWRSETGQWFSTAPPATSAPVTAIERSAGLPEMSAPAAFAEPVSAGPREGNLPTGEARKSTRQRRKKASMARPSTNGASLQTNVCPVMPVWVSDWLASGSIQAQDPLEEGAFFHLLCLEWQQPDLGLPDNDNELAILSRLGPRWFKKPHPKATMTCGERIRKSFLQKGGRLYNNRLLRERQKQVEHREKMAEAGLRGAAKRWGGDGLAKGQNIARPFSKHGLAIHQKTHDGKANAMAIAFDGSPSPSPRKEDPHSPPPGEIGFDFESHFQELWRAYPKKGQTKPPMAEQQYGEKLMAAPDREALHREILDAVTGKWARSKLWATGYINGLAEFLRLERWREDPEPAAGTDGGGYPEWPGVS